MPLFSISQFFFTVLQCKAGTFDPQNGGYYYEETSIDVYLKTTNFGILLSVSPKVYIHEETIY